MTKTASAARARIVELFQTLPTRDQRALVEQLSETTRGPSVYHLLSPAQLAAIDEGIAEAERGDTFPLDETFDDLAQKFGFHNA